MTVTTPQLPNVIDPAKLKAIMGAETEKYSHFVQDFFRAYAINTPKRQAAFLSQVSHESGYFKRVVENLNYSNESLKKTFLFYKRNPKTADKHGRTSGKRADQRAIANHAYANRMGNGGPETNDGWNFRGKGLIQITGKDNTSAFANAIGMPLTEAISYLETPKGALHGAIWYWNRSNLNALADKSDVRGITKAINGGYNGLDDRIALYKKYSAILGA